MTTLRHYRLCPHSRSIRILLRELKQVVELAEDKPWTWPADLVALTPAGELPVFVAGDGQVIAGAYAISEWLSDDLIGERPGDAVDASAGCVFPGDAAQRAEVRRLVDWFHGKMHREVTSHLLDEKVYARFRNDGRDSAPDPETLRAVRANMAVHIRYVDHLAAGRKWLAGETLSFADHAAAAQISVVDYLGGIEWASHEAAKLWYARMKSRPSVRDILAERVPGAPPPPEHYDDPDF